MSVPIAMADVIITAPTPQEAIRVAAKQGTSSKALRIACVSLTDKMNECGKHPRCT